MAGFPFVRDHLVDALQAELVGPYSLQADSTETLPEPPRRWYLSGFLAPVAAKDASDGDESDELGAGGEGVEEPEAAEPQPKQRRRHQSSMGLTVLVSEAAPAFEVLVSYADYVADKSSATSSEEGAPGRAWRRLPRPTRTMQFSARDLPKEQEVPTEPGEPRGLYVRCVASPLAPAEGAQDVQAVAVFLVNKREEPSAQSGRDHGYVFQASIAVRCPGGLVAWPQGGGNPPREQEDRTAQLQYRQQHRYASGHNVATTTDQPEQGRITTARTCWLPRQELRSVEHRSAIAVPGLELRMERLAQLDSPAAVRKSLRPLAEAYGSWLAEQKSRDLGLSELHATARDGLLKTGRQMQERIEQGIYLLERDAETRQAFCWANEAMDKQARRIRETAPGAASERPISAGEPPAWRMFQLAFLLANLAGCRDPDASDRSVVDLIFFPTGGGKTEAYLGVIAFVVMLRRLRGQARTDAGLGVAVILRYTLRLLTLDQLGRAATLFCALDLIRAREPQRLGAERLTIGLWVGSEATPKDLTGMQDKIDEFKKNEEMSPPCPLSSCPWCKTSFSKQSFDIPKSPFRQVRTLCADANCAFNVNHNVDGLPISYVDDHLYDEPPAMLLSTVDKMAMLPWRGASAKLFGQAQARLGAHILGFDDKRTKGDMALATGLAPPELLVQDELHLIGGPLGTMVGLYESAIQLACERPFQGKSCRPKIIAASATARRAQQQIKSLFGREQTAVFPPPGVDIHDNFFSISHEPDAERPGRLYVGIAASGRAFKNVLIRAYVTLLAAAEHAHQEQSGSAGRDPSDGYMTLVGYFNSLRELGGMRRLVEDDVESRLRRHDERHPSDLRESLWAKHRERGARVLRELTSRERMAAIKETRESLGRPFPSHARDNKANAERSAESIDVLLASNMISVGIDIDRLGLMVVAGQPKTVSEYIQATSRVGRDKFWPGLVVVCFNIHRARDRSHYEHFQAFHEAFYRKIEATSLTPLSRPALRRGLLGTWMLALRILTPQLLENHGAARVGAHRGDIEKIGQQLIAHLCAREVGQGGLGELEVGLATWLEQRLQSELDRWCAAAEDGRLADLLRFSRLQASPAAPKGRKWLDLLRMASQGEEGSAAPAEEIASIDAEVDGRFSSARTNAGLQPVAAPTFVLPTSMREVESSVSLWLNMRRPSRSDR